MYFLGNIVYLLCVLSHDEKPWISALSLKCTGADSCRRKGKDGLAAVNSLTCSGDRSCRGFDVEASTAVSCSGISSCEHITWKRGASMQCDGVNSCSSVIGWMPAGNLGSFSSLRSSYPQIDYQIGIEIGGIVYPSNDLLWASNKLIVTSEVVHGDDPRGFKVVRYIYAEGLQYNNGLTDVGASASTWYRFLYEQHGENSNNDVLSLVLLSNDEAQISANVNVYYRKYFQRWHEIGTVSEYATLRKRWYQNEWEMAVGIDGHIAIVLENIWDGKKRFATEPYVCIYNGILKRIQAVFLTGLIDPTATEQLTTNWYIYYYEVGGEDSFTFLPDISSTITVASNKLYVRFR